MMLMVVMVVVVMMMMMPLFIFYLSITFARGIRWPDKYSCEGATVVKGPVAIKIIKCLLIFISAVWK